MYRVLESSRPLLRLHVAERARVQGQQAGAEISCASAHPWMAYLGRALPVDARHRPRFFRHRSVPAFKRQVYKGRHSSCRGAMRTSQRPDSLRVQPQPVRWLHRVRRDRLHHLRVLAVLWQVCRQPLQQCCEQRRPHVRVLDALRKGSQLRLVLGLHGTLRTSRLVRQPQPVTTLRLQHHRGVLQLLACRPPAPLLVH